MIEMMRAMGRVSQRIRKSIKIVDALDVKIFQSAIIAVKERFEGLTSNNNAAMKWKRIASGILKILQSLSYYDRHLSVGNLCNARNVFDDKMAKNALALCCHVPKF